jgi:hypothetical protein
MRWARRQTWNDERQESMNWLWWSMKQNSYSANSFDERTTFYSKLRSAPCQTSWKVSFDDYIMVLFCKCDVCINFVDLRTNAKSIRSESYISYGELRMKALLDAVRFWLIEQFSKYVPYLTTHLSYMSIWRERCALIDVDSVRSRTKSVESRYADPRHPRWMIISSLTYGQR